MSLNQTLVTAVKKAFQAADDLVRPVELTRTRKTYNFDTSTYETQTVETFSTQGIFYAVQDTTDPTAAASQRLLLDWTDFSEPLDPTWVISAGGQQYKIESLAFHQVLYELEVRGLHAPISTA